MIVIVEGGMVTAVYADSKEVLVNVLDMDTQDSDLLDELDAQRGEIQERAEKGELYDVW